MGEEKEETRRGRGGEGTTLSTVGMDSLLMHRSSRVWRPQYTHCLHTLSYCTYTVLLRYYTVHSHCTQHIHTHTHFTHNCTCTAHALHTAHTHLGVELVVACEPRHGEVDAARVHSAHGLRRQPQTRHDARGEVLHHHVRALQQLPCVGEP